MTAIITRLVYALGLQECPNQERRSTSRAWPWQGCITIETNWVTAEELNEAIRPIWPAFLAEVCVRGWARTA
jgi:hypothetical protein